MGLLLEPGTIAPDFDPNILGNPLGGGENKVNPVLARCVGSLTPTFSKGTGLEVVLPINGGGGVETSTVVCPIRSHSYKERGHGSGLAELVGDGSQVTGG
jgi:hypothetical protein